MASSTTTTVLLLSVILTLLTLTTARPCKTIFFITSSSYSLPIPNTQNPNPNSPRFTFFITEIHQFHRTRLFPNPSSNDIVSSKPYLPPPTDRAMDIMTIVGALLFGVGCGALTAGTIYLIWSLFSTRREDEDFASDSDSDYYHEDDVTNNGYAAVPTAAKEVPPSADEVDAMKK